MYSEIVNYKYSEVKRRYHNIKSISNASKVITMYNNEVIDSFSNESDILLYFDVVTEELLTIVERLEKPVKDMDKLTAAVEEFNNKHLDYVANITENEDFIDLMIVHNSLALTE